MKKHASEHQLVKWVVILLLVSIHPLPSTAQQEPDCKNLLEKAVEMYDVRNYTGVVDKFLDCPVGTYRGTQKKRADEIIAISVKNVYSDDMDYDRVIKILSKYPVDEFDLENEKTKLYEVLGESYFRKQGVDSDAGKKTVFELAAYTIDDSYRPDEQEVSAIFIETFVNARKRLTEKAAVGDKPGSSLKWYLIAGGTVAAGVLTALLLSGGGSEQLPLPPGSPNSN